MNLTEALARAQRAEELDRQATPGPWFTVDHPWRPTQAGTYVVAGNPDPHVGQPVLDSIEIDEWPAGVDEPDYTQSDNDLGFAAESRNLLPALARDVRVLAKALARAALATFNCDMCAVHSECQAAEVSCQDPKAFAAALLARAEAEVGE